MSAPPTKIISFDVGIKNMAFCLFQTHSSFLQKQEILEWDVLDLGTAPASTPDGSVPAEPTNTLKPLCSSCRKVAMYFRSNAPQTPTPTPPTPTPTQYYCKKHAEPEILPRKGLSSLSREDLVVLGEKIPPSRLPPSSPQWSKKKWTDYLKMEMLQPVPAAKKVRSANDVSLLEIGRSLVVHLDRLLYPQHGDIAFVLIENQISPIATRMKTIQGMLAQYFIMRFPKAHIEFISSHNKLKGTVGAEGATTTIPVKASQSAVPKPATPANGQSAAKYKQNKQQSIEAVSKWLQENSTGEIFRLFEKHKKKDDLSDSLLQGLWFVKARL